jgi:hypothetical protein
LTTLPFFGRIQTMRVIIDCFFLNSLEVFILKHSTPRTKAARLEDHLEKDGYKLPPLTLDEYNLLIRRLLLDPPFPIALYHRLDLVSKVLENAKVRVEGSEEDAPNYS